MKTYVEKNINVKRLLSLGDLDVRGFAAANKDFPADEFFLRIENFIKNSSKYWEVIAAVADIEKNIKALKDLEKRLGVSERPVDISSESEKPEKLEIIKAALTEIAYENLNSEIDAICVAIKNGDSEFAAELAENVLAKYNRLVNRTFTTYTVKRFVKKPNEEEEAITLSEVLEYYDHIEATRKLRILAVDDVTVVLNSITSMLSPYYDVYALKSSTKVEEFLMHTTPELFLLDIEMEEINGFDLIPIIRQHEKHKDTPIIILTGNASLENIKLAVSHGACDFVAKPVNTDILLEKIEKYIIRVKAY